MKRIRMESLRAGNERMKSNRARLKPVCPFVVEPRENCYCYKLKSQEQILGALYYCQGRFHSCKIYISQTEMVEDDSMVEAPD
jgi:hypothetical protein